MATQTTTKNGTATNEAPPSAMPVYPFTAIVGQEDLKRALLLCVIDPTIGGVMVMGHRG
ncbi:MAG: magnesium chelatase ATPase subunit I, partial [Chloroflexota bacterium]